jgi:hypothetical protein
MAKDTTKKVNRGPLKPRMFFMLYRGELQGDPKITFDKMDALETVLAANKTGDTSLKMQILTVPKGNRKKADAPVTAA